MFTNGRKELKWLDRGKDRCLHYYELDNQSIESLIKRHIYSRGLGGGINIRPTYTYKTHYVRKVIILRHWWCRLSFCCDGCVISSKVLVILIFVNMGRLWSIGYVLIIARGWSCWNRFFYPIYLPCFTNWFID